MSKKRIILNKISPIFLALILSCSFKQPLKTLKVRTEENITNLIQQQKLDQNENVSVVNINENEGASFFAKININDFNVKANTNGTALKTSADVAKVDVYLLELATPPTAGSDPLGVANVNVVSSATNLAKTGASFNILFQGVPANTTGKKYYVAAVIKDTAGTVINKAPATPWTGNTFTSAPNILVSASGVGVSTSLVVDTTVDLTLSFNLLDGVGAVVSTNVNSVNGVFTNPALATAMGSYVSNKIFVIAGNTVTTGVKPDTSGTQNATSSSLNAPLGVAIDSTGNVYISDYQNNLIEKIDTAGKIKVIAGNSFSTGVKADTSGTQNATSVSLFNPNEVAVDISGNVYITDQVNQLVEKIDTAGKIKVIAGNSFSTGVKADTSGTQNATSVSLNFPTGVAVDISGNVYITDQDNHLIEKIDTAGKIKVIAGNSFNTGVKADTNGTQNATSVSLNGPFGVAVDNTGNVYITDRLNNLVEKIDTAGKIKVVAGNSFNTGVKADTNGTQNATSVSLNGPFGVAVDNTGNVYITDRLNNLVEKIDTAGKIKVIAGNSFNTGVKPDTTGTQSATTISLNTPYGVTIDNNGNMYIADTYNNLIEKLVNVQ